MSLLLNWLSFVLNDWLLWFKRSQQTIWLLLSTLRSRLSQLSSLKLSLYEHVTNSFKVNLLLWFKVCEFCALRLAQLFGLLSRAHKHCFDVGVCNLFLSQLLCNHKRNRVPIVRGSKIWVITTWQHRNDFLLFDLLFQVSWVRRMYSGTYKFRFQQNAALFVTSDVELTPQSIGDNILGKLSLL